MTDEIRKPTTDDFFKEGDQLVYELVCDNCELYEDSANWTEGIFSSWEQAVKYIEEKFPNAKLSYHIKWDSKLDWNPKDKFNQTRFPKWYQYDEDEDGFGLGEWKLTIVIYNLRTGKRVPFDNVHIFLKEDWEDGRTE